MQILGVFINCAKIVAAVVIVTLLMAAFKYLYMRFRGLLPTVEATAFIFSVAGANLACYWSVCLILWLRLAYCFSSFYGQVTMFIVLFVAVLCGAIAGRLEISKRNIFINIGLNNKRVGADARNMSNSYLAITPVLLS